MAIGTVCCPLCSAAVSSAEMEHHLRAELGHSTLRCLLCPAEFFAVSDAEAHFRGPFARHPNDALRYAEHHSPE